MQNLKAPTLLALLATLCLTACAPIQATPPTPTAPASAAATRRATAPPPPVTVVVAVVTPPATPQLPTAAPSATTTATESPLAQAESTVIAPDGQRVAYFFGLYKARLIVTDAAGVILQDIDEGNLDTEGEFRFVAWSADSQRLYFTTHVYFDGNGIGFYDGVGLRQLDVVTGQLTELLPDRDAAGYWQPSVFALAPDETQLAYVVYADQHYDLILRDLSTGAERRLLLESYTGAGSLVWSPQGDQLALALTTDEDWANGFTIAVIDTVTLTTPQVVYTDTRLLDPISWTKADELVLRERGGGDYVLDLTSRELRIAPTQTPTND